jgi:hypothetical protein
MLSLSLYLPGDRLSARLCVVCTVGYNNSSSSSTYYYYTHDAPPTRTCKQTIPTALRPNGACPTATAAAATTTTH